MKNLETGIQRIPNRDCHCHLEGSIYPETFERLRPFLPSHAPRFPSPFVYKLPRNFKTFLRQFRLHYPLFKNRETYSIILDGMLSQLARDDIREAEIHVNLALAKTFNHDPFPLFDTLWAVRNRWKESRGVDCRFIADIPWQFPPDLFRPFLSEPEYFQKRGVIGLSLGGDEQLAAPDYFKHTLETGAKNNYQILCHCGEIPGDYAARDILNMLPVTRLIHAVSTARSPDLIKKISERNIEIDVCFTSNKLLIGVKTDKHPWRIFVENGIPIAFGSDDPAIFNTTPKEELKLARQICENAGEGVIVAKKKW